MSLDFTHAHDKPTSVICSKCAAGMAHTSPAALQSSAFLSTWACACCSPLHACKKCGQEAGDTGSPQELVPCRLCPTAYHAACMPSVLGGKHSKLRKVWLAERDEAGGIDLLFSP